MKKIIGFIICTLLITTTGFSAIGFKENGSKINEKYREFTLEHQSLSEGLFEWPMFRQNLNNTGYSPSSAPDDDTILWSKDICYLLDSNPTIKDDRLYIACNTFKRGGEIFCLNPFNGTEIWKTIQISDEIWGSPTVANGRVYVLGTYLNLYCYDAYNGDVLWKYEAYGHCSPMVVEDKVYFSNYGGGFVCLNASTGEEIWVFDPSTDYQASTPAIVDGKIYVGDDPYNQPGTLHCLDASLGDEIWNYTTGAGIWSSPSAYGNKVYFASDQLYCLNATNGDEVWIEPGIATSSSPAVAYGNVYIGDDGKVYCFDADNGDLIWDSQPLGTSIWNAAAVADGKVYIFSSGGSGRFNCLDAYTGDIIWQYESGSGSCSSPAVAYGNVYVGTIDGIYAFGIPNEPPEIPMEPDGPSSGFVDVEYSFNISTTDPEGDDIYYLIDWGDGSNSGWLGPCASEAIVTISHIWDEEGEYEIKVKAHDGKRESEWSEPHIIIIEDVPQPILDVEKIKGGLFSAKADIKNFGDLDATNVSWSIEFEGGAFINKKTEGSGLDIPIGERETITSKPIVGFGPTMITAKAWLPEISDTKIQSGFVFLFFVTVSPGG